MCGDLTGTRWNLEDVVTLIDAHAEPAKKRKPKKPGAVA